MSTETLSLIIAIIAVILGPVVSYIIAKKQLRAEIVYASHLDDLKLLRNTIIDLLKTFSDLIFLINLKIAKTIEEEEFQKKMNPLFTELMLFHDRISLLIDVENKSHAELIIEIQKTPNIILNDSDPDWIEKSIRQSGKISSMANKILYEKKKEIENKF